MTTPDEFVKTNDMAISGLILLFVTILSVTMASREARASDSAATSGATTIETSAGAEKPIEKPDDKPAEKTPSIQKQNQKKPTSEASVCSRTHLLQKDCHIFLGRFRIQVWNDKILLNTRTDRLTKPLPIQADVNAAAVMWDFVRGSSLNKRWILEIGLWTPPAGEGDVETLQWTAYEVTPTALIKQVEKPIQKRKKISDAKYKFDKMIAHGLNVKSGKIIWHVGREQGSFE